MKSNNIQHYSFDFQLITVQLLIYFLAHLPGEQKHEDNTQRWRRTEFVEVEYRVHLLPITEAQQQVL